MTTGIAEPARARRSLPLTERDLAGIERVRRPGPERSALSELAGVEVENVTEDALLNIIFAVGLQAISERAEERAYARAADDRAAYGVDAQIRRIDRRRRPSGADSDEAIETTTRTRRYSPLAKRSYAAGLLEGARDVIRIAAKARGLTLTDDQAAQIDACEDAPTLESWLRAAVNATDASDIFG